MALVRIPRTPLDMGSLIGISVVSGSSTTLDGTTIGVGIAFTMPHGDGVITLDKVHVGMQAVTSSQSVDGQIQTLATTDATPSGTAYNSCSVSTVGSPSANTILTFDFSAGTAPAATAGDAVALEITWTSTTGDIDISNVSGNTALLDNPAVSSDTGGGYSLSNNKSPSILLEFSDGAKLVPPGCSPPFTSTVTKSFTDSSNPDAMAFQFTPSYNCTLGGVTFYGREFGSTADIEIELFDDAATPASLAGPTIMNHDQLIGTNRACNVALEEYDLTSGTTYNIRVKNKDTSNNLWIYGIDNVDSDWGDGWDECVCATQNNNGAFTTDTTQKLLGGPVLTKIDDGAGGGGSNSGARNPVGIY